MNSRVRGIQLRPPLPVLPWFHDRIEICDNAVPIGNAAPDEERTDLQNRVSEQDGNRVDNRF